MKKFIRFLALMLVAMLCFSGCAKKETEIPGDEIVSDITMSNGIGVMGTESISDLGTITYEFNYLDSVPDTALSMWRLGQWGTKFGFADSVAKGTGEEVQDGDNYILRDNTKEVIVNPKTGQYSLNCFATDEYPTPKQYGEAWLHLITIQNVVDISRVSEMKNIYADLDFSIDFCEDLMGEQLDPGVHTALFQWVFAINNVNPDSPDYNQYFWFNIPYYDGRGLTIESWQTFDEYAMLDHGKEDKTNSFIYSLSSDGYFPEGGIQLGERYRIVIDLIPYIQKALTTIQELDQNTSSDYPMLLNTTLDDLRITQFYIGWEVPGTFNCGCTIYKNSLKYNRIEE